MDDYDFLIVGSGISGLYMGLKLRQAGFKTLNIDRSMDLGYPSTGSAFIPIETFARYFKNYENYVNGVFSSVSIDLKDSEEEFKLPSNKKIVSMDREKLVRSMAVSLSQNDGPIAIATILQDVKKSDNTNMEVNLRMEGKLHTIKVGKIIISDSDSNSSLLKHESNCNAHTTTAKYSRGIVGKFPEENFKIKLKHEGISLEASYSGTKENLQINKKSERDNFFKSTFEYLVHNHTCFPSTSSNIIPSGNIMGSKNYLGTGISFCLKVSDTILSCIKSEKNEEIIGILKQTFSDLSKENDFTNMDAVDSILYRIPIFS
jgi:hypothetical protein